MIICHVRRSYTGHFVMQILLRRKLHPKLPSVTYRDSNLSRILLLLPQALQKVELHCTFRNNCGNDFIDFFSVADTRNVQSANQDPNYPLLGPRKIVQCNVQRLWFQAQYSCYYLSNLPIYTQYKRAHTH